MPGTKTLPIYIILLFVALHSHHVCLAQLNQSDAAKWAQELSRKEFNDESFTSHILLLGSVDSLKAFEYLDAIEKRGDLDQYYFRTRYNCLQANVILNKIFRSRLYQEKKPADKEKIKTQLIDLHNSALDAAYSSEDDGLIAFASLSFAETMNRFRETGKTLMYTKNAIDLYEKINHPVTPYQYQVLAELLYKVREYAESITYAKKAIEGYNKLTNNEKLSCTNTIALDYHRQQKYDSAMFFYNEALQLAHASNHIVWIGIVSGNMGQIYYARGKYKLAYPLLKQDYSTSIHNGEIANGANSLQWAARVDLALGNKTLALSEVQEAMRLLKTSPEINFIRNSYFASSQIFRELGVYDSAFYYNDLYNNLNDSLEKLVATSSLAISSARLNDERSRYQIQNLNTEKRSEIMWRNFIIIFIVLLSLSIFLVINRKLLKSNLKREKAEQEMVSAQEQLQMFTSNLIEKTTLVEKLQMQAVSRQASLEQQALISEISQHTILTEEDWVKFKLLFEKIYPAFLVDLKEKVPDITIAELRMAALTRLRLTTNQIASILGISPNSVYKTKQRLRQRLRLEGDTLIEGGMEAAD
jgi:DNA-binding CsgD family transcriptional regulator